VARSAVNGRYELLLVGDARARDRDSLRFQLDGFREQKLRLAASLQEGNGDLRLDAQLMRRRDAVTLEGRLQARTGEPVTGERVALFSRSVASRYRGVSDDSGYFRIADVEIAPDYELTVRPRGPFRDHVRRPVAVDLAGGFFDIVLEPLDAGRLTGHMVDAEGEPLAGLRLWLHSSWAREKAVQVWSDDVGSFEAEAAPAGPLKFFTHSAPALRVDGIHLDPGEDREVLLVLDSGEQVLGGRILDERGEPLAGARVSLG
jgi:hypothetical protein